jgi:hypothetical protein
MVRLFYVKSRTYNYLNSVTVTDGHTEGYNKTVIHVYTKVSFAE